MRSRVTSVPEDTPVRELIDDYLMTSDQSAFPVVRDGRLVGLVTMEDVRGTPRDHRDELHVSHIMTPADELTTTSPDHPAADVLDTLTRRSIGHVPVVENGRLAGVVRREDILKWLSLHGPGKA